MLYLVFVLTFLCGILFYSLSPRDDQLKWDMHRAEGFIAGFLAQHQSAKDYIAAWLGVDYKSKADSAFKLNKKTDERLSFLLYTPMGTAIDLSSNQEEVGFPSILGGAGEIQTSIFCLDESGGAIGCNNPDVKDVYLASYSQIYCDESDECYWRPPWWPNENANRQRRYGSWRRAITHRTRGSYSCGVLTCAGTWTDNECNKWCIDNGQTVLLPNNDCAQRVPDSIIDLLKPSGVDSERNFRDVLFCISKIKNGPGEYYAPGITAFYDAINNRNTGAEGERASKDAWADLVRTQEVCSLANPEDTHCAVTSDSYSNGVDFSIDHNAAYFYGSKYIKIPVQVGDTTNGPFKNFTWTVLLGAPDKQDSKSITFFNTGNFSLRFENNGSNVGYIRLYDGETSVPQSSNGLKLTDNQVLSLTVIGSQDDIKVYANDLSDPIFTYSKASWGGRGYSGDIDSVFIKTTNANSEYLYGIRYYKRQLTSKNRLRAGQIELSELAQNFNVDSKRYGIGKVEIDEEEEGA
jgi:hypothetical protein